MFYYLLLSVIFTLSSKVGSISGIVYYILLHIIHVIHFSNFLLLCKWPIRPSAGEWLKNMGQSHTMHCFSAIKMNIVLIQTR